MNDSLTEEVEYSLNACLLRVIVLHRLHYMRCLKECASMRRMAEYHALNDSLSLLQLVV